MRQRQVVRAARQYVGVPYRHQGRDAVSGLDCLGLVIAVARDIGHDVTLDRTDYERITDGVELRDKLLDSGMTEGSLPEPGDVVQICFRGLDGYGQHVGIVADGAHELHLIHAYERARTGRVIIEPLRRWRNGMLGNIKAIYRFPY